MKTATKEKIESTVKQSLKPVLTVIINKGRVVDNSRLPVSCRYCELKWEQL